MDLPENRIDPSESLIGLYYLSAREAATEVIDVEFEARVYGDGSIEIHNKILEQDDPDRARIKLSPSQVAALGLLIDSASVPKYKEKI